MKVSILLTEKKKTNQQPNKKLKNQTPTTLLLCLNTKNRMCILLENSQLFQGNLSLSSKDFLNAYFQIIGTSNTWTPAVWLQFY